MPLKFAMVCASNMNRSMEAHRLAIKAGLCVRSFGVGQHVKLPGASANSPNVYDFGTTYEHIYKDLKQKDQALYTRNGLLMMLERNMKIKEAAERWQSNTVDVFDCVITFERRIFETLVEDMRRRVENGDGGCSSGAGKVALDDDDNIVDDDEVLSDGGDNRASGVSSAGCGHSLLVINIDVKDKAAEAAAATPLAIDLCKEIDACEDWEDDIVDILERFQTKTGRKPTYTVCFY